MGGPTSSYAAAGIALGFIGVHKPSHPATESFQQGGDTIDEEICMYTYIIYKFVNKYV
jgi:hypothetical protein